MNKVLIVLFFILSLIGCSENDDVNRNYDLKNKVQIINGEPAEHSEYPSSFALMSKWVDTPICSGTLIKSNLGITAAHCIHGKNIKDLSVAYGYSDAVDDGSLILLPILDAIIHEGYLDPSLTGLEPSDPPDAPGTAGQNVGDIALILIDNSYSPVNIIFADILPPELYDEVLNVGDYVVAVGYGQNEKGIPGHEFHKGDVPVIWRGKYEMVLGLDEDLVPNPTNSCYGDSGSGAYITCNECLYVTGVASRSPTLPECGHGAVYTIPGSYLEWINESYEEMMENVGKCEPCDGCEDCEICETVDGGTGCVMVNVEEAIGSTCRNNGCSCSAAGEEDDDTLLFIMLMFLFFILLRN